MPPSRSESTGASSTATGTSFGSAASSSAAPSSPVTALPTEEALQILLSPDGYYKYLAVPKPEPDIMGPKYQAAMAAGGGGGGDGGEIDLDRVKKNYRRLSLKHHPDRKTGDAETFRMLNRAKVVLSSPKLRREYDLVGLDLEDDAEDHHEEDNAASPSKSQDENGDGADGKEAHHEDCGGKDGNNSKTETVMGHLASATLAAVLQVVVRTGLMGLVSVLVSRYTILTILAFGMLAFLTTKMYKALKASLGQTKAPVNFSSMKEAFSPMVIAFGIFCMYRGRRFVIDVATTTVTETNNSVVGDSTAAATAAETREPTYLDWSWTFWLGETIVMTSFVANSFEKRPNLLLALVAVPSLLLSLWLRGRFWRYATLLGFEGVIALLVVLAFPVMEMILESIVEEKMRKVGEKIRTHDARMKEILRRKKERQQGGSDS